MECNTAVCSLEVRIPQRGVMYQFQWIVPFVSVIVLYLTRSMLRLYGVECKVELERKRSCPARPFCSLSPYYVAVVNGCSCGFLGLATSSFRSQMAYVKTSEFLDLRPTTPKHEMFYHFKSHLSM